MEGASQPSPAPAAAAEDHRLTSLEVRGRRAVFARAISGGRILKPLHLQLDVRLGFRPQRATVNVGEQLPLPKAGPASTGSLQNTATNADQSFLSPSLSCDSPLGYKSVRRCNACANHHLISLSSLLSLFSLVQLSSPGL